MRDCLRLVYERKNTKKIAQLLVGPGGKPLTPGTVDNYIAQAVHLLGATDRYEAADLLHASETTTTSYLEVQPSGVAPSHIDQPPELSARSPWWRTLPIRLNGATSNDLSIRQRLIGILLIAFGIAVGLGSIASTLHVASEFVRSHNAR